jgi:hypothetical protein
MYDNVGERIRGTRKFRVEGSAKFRKVIRGARDTEIFITLQ